MAAAMLVGVSGCRKYSGEEAAQKRADWTASLHDSIAQVAAQRHTDSLRIEQLRAEMAENISRFTMVNNPREVEPYYILSAFKSQYPLKSTGIAARMMKNEQAEIIAALSGGRFNAIRVTSPQGEVTSDVVPADQALNYTAGGLTTVAFSGNAADSICEFVAAHREQPLTLEYLQNGSAAKRITLSQNQKQWIASTWDLCGANKETRILEKRMLVSSRKIEILRLTLNREEAKAVKTDR